MRVVSAYFIFIADINHSCSVFATSELIINPNIRSLLCNISLRPPLLRFLYIYSKHASSLYGMFLFIVKFLGPIWFCHLLRLCGYKFLTVGLMSYRCKTIPLLPPYWIVRTVLCCLSQITGTFPTGCWILEWQMTWSGLGWWVSVPLTSQRIGPHSNGDVYSDVTVHHFCYGSNHWYIGDRFI